jgi:MFS family permease
MIIYLTIVASALNGFFLSLNFKNYGMTKINDDHFVSVVGMSYLTVTALGSMLWGLVADKMIFKYVYMIIMFIVGILTFTLPFVSEIKICFAIWILLIGVFNSGFAVLAGPLLIYYFGLENAQKLVAFKSSASFIGILIHPFL